LVSQTQTAKADSAAGPVPFVPVIVAGIVCLTLLAAGDKLLGDADVYWHTTVGRWILEHGALPHADSFSFTFAGKPWIAKEWLSQVIFAGAFSLAGWSGVVALSAIAVALAFGLLAGRLQGRLDMLPLAAMMGAAFILVAPHLVARPHVLALPIAVAWTAALFEASWRGARPPWLILPLMAVWTNLHGGFLLGLAMAGPAALEAILAAPAARRIATALAWTGFGLAAIAMALVTPYGPQTVLAAFKVLGLGGAQAIIGEWKPQDFSTIDGFEIVLLAALFAGFAAGFRIPPVRLAVLLGLLHLALSHVRHADFLGLFAPLLLAAPLAAQFPALRAPASLRRAPVLAAVAMGGLVLLGALTLAMSLDYRPADAITPSAAVDALKRAGARRIFNAYDFGGYLIAAGMPTFIDGRTELFGPGFTIAHDDAVRLADLTGLEKLLEEWKVDATLLPPQAPAVAYLDRMPGWKRLHGDGIAVAHVRVTPAP
jgi:hypothetical protein